MKGKKYIQVVINSESDLPKDDAQYVFKVKGNDKLYAYNGEIIRAYGMKVEWYLREEPEQSSSESSTEPIKTAEEVLNAYNTSIFAVTRNEALQAMKEHTSQYRNQRTVSEQKVSDEEIEEWMTSTYPIQSSDDLEIFEGRNIRKFAIICMKALRDNKIGKK